MRYFVGIDLHSDNNYLGVIDRKDSRVLGKKLPQRPWSDIRGIGAV